jgi:hypothetical protein
VLANPNDSSYTNRKHQEITLTHILGVDYTDNCTSIECMGKRAWGFTMQPLNVVRNNKYNVDYNIHSKGCI